MSWNYRVVRYKDGSGFGVHEVYYDGDGKATQMTERAVGFVGESVEEVSAAMRKARQEAFTRPVFDEPESW